MNSLPSGIEEIVLESGQTIEAITYQAVSAPSPPYANQTVIYNLIGIKFYKLNNILLINCIT